MAEQEERATDPTIILIAQSYLAAHGDPIHPARTEFAVTTLLKSEDGEALALEETTTLHHEALIPFLISALDGANRDVALRRLRQVTFEESLHTKEQWHEWHQQHLAECRADWANRAKRNVDLLACYSPALAALEIGKPCWVDIQMLSAMEDFARHPALRSAIAKWVVQVYHPLWRLRLSRLASIAGGNQKGHPHWYVERAFQDLGFWPGGPASWEQYVLLK